MIKVNLVGKKRREARGRNWIVTGLISVFVIFIVYFISLSIFVVARLIILKNEQKAVTTETETLSRQITANNELLRGFILSKYILGKVDSLNKEKFPYKIYLDQLVTLMPEDVVMRNVDFASKGWVAVIATAPGLVPLHNLEANLKDQDRLSSTAFNSIFTESVTKEKTGIYTVKLQIELRKNGSK